MTFITAVPNTPHHARRAFTVVELLVAVTISGLVLAGVWSANLQIVRNGLRLGSYVEMDAQVRRALDTLGRDLRTASAITWNGNSDITLSLPAGNATVRSTYAWSSSNGTFYRVAGNSSATTSGRLELIRGIPARSDGSAGLTFARFDRDGAAATTDAATKSVQVTLAVARTSSLIGASTSEVVSTTFTLRSKP